MNILESLSRGLRSAGGVLNPAVQSQLGQEQLQEDIARRQMAQQMLKQRIADEREQALARAVGPALEGGDFAAAARAAVGSGAPGGVNMGMQLLGQDEARKARAQQFQMQLTEKAMTLRQRHEDKMAELASRNASAAERQEAAIQAQREMAQFRADTQKSMAQFAASLRPAPQPKIVNTAEGIMELTPKGLQPLLNSEGKPVMPPSIAGSAQFSPEALELTAQQYLAGDSKAVQGYARNAAARIALQNEIAKQAKAMGMDAKTVAAKMAEFAGITAASRTVGQRSANIEMSAAEAQEMIPIVRETSAKFDRTNFVPANKAIKMYEENTGTPEVKAFGAALNSLVNVYARAISPGGVPTVSDKEHAREMISTIQSPAQIEAVLGVMEKELVAARKAPEHVREALRNAVLGKKSAPAQKVQKEWSDAQYMYRQLEDGSIQRKKK